MNEYVKSISGMDGMSDEAIAADFLLSVKSRIIYTSMALTETDREEKRKELEKQLARAVATYEEIKRYMKKKGYTYPVPLRKYRQQTTPDYTPDTESM